MQVGCVQEDVGSLRLIFSCDMLFPVNDDGQTSLKTTSRQDFEDQGDGFRSSQPILAKTQTRVS